MMNVKLLLVSSLEKIFPDEEPRAFDGRVEGLLNESVSFQAAWKTLDELPARDYVQLHIVSPVEKHLHVRRVRYVPVLFPTFPDADDNYLRKTPGLYPDALTEVEFDRFRSWSNHWEAAWITIESGEDFPAGEYPIEIILEDMDGNRLASQTAVYRRIDARLPAQTLIRTQWFHCDALCDSYRTEMFSEDFWTACENFVRTAAKRGINCILTPIHTPPLDTRVGGERRTCQLVDIEIKDGAYSFGFEKLRRWVEMCRRAGMEYFEMAHLFTQWGAEHAPKIVARVNGEEKRIFGWDTDATGEDYVRFLQSYLPALTAELDNLGVRERTLFHISDEPGPAHLDNYMKARCAVKPYLEGFTIMDALSDVNLYRSGAVEHPVPSSNHIRPFLEENIPGLWTYYCISQYKDVSNAFVAMPSARTRILGVQLYKYRIAGFLQWGYNFYNAQFSEYTVNPFLTTDGDGFSPAGDCYIVYPGKNLMPIETIRLMSMDEAMNDLRALNLLEQLRGRDFTMKLVEADVAPIEFDRYPIAPSYLTSLRQRVNAEIEKATTRG